MQRCENVNLIRGHVFMIGREFQGEECKAMRMAATNVPTQTWFDVFRSWEGVRTQLPKERLEGGPGGVEAANVQHDEGTGASAEEIERRGDAYDEGSQYASEATQRNGDWRAR